MGAAGRSDEAPASDPAADVLWMIRGYWVTLSLRATIELGLLEQLDQPTTVPDLARACSAPTATMARMLRALEDLRLVARDEDGRYSRAPSGDLLRAGHPSRLRDQIMMQSDLANLGAWHRLADAVRTGAATFEAANGVSHWDYLRADPDKGATFNAAMARRSGMQAAALLGAGVLTEVSTVVDVGGGSGGLLLGLLRELPGLRGVVAEQAEVAAEASARFAAEGLGDRASAVAVDFFESVPSGADGYIVSNVLHDWDDRQAVGILRSVRAAMPDHGRLWIVEQVLDAPGRSFEQTRDLHLLDLHMLVSFGARERTVAEYGELLRSAGCSDGRLVGTESSWNVLEARPTGPGSR